MMILGALAVCGSVLWFIYTSFVPVEVPPPPPPRKALSFDTRVDVSQNKVFGQLHTLLENADLKPAELGRTNPFMPIPKPQSVATSTAGTATSTGVTSTSTPATTTPAVSGVNPGQP